MLIPYTTANIPKRKMTDNLLKRVVLHAMLSFSSVEHVPRRRCDADCPILAADSRSAIPHARHVPFLWKPILCSIGMCPSSSSLRRVHPRSMVAARQPRERALVFEFFSEFRHECVKSRLDTSQSRGLLPPSFPWALLHSSGARFASSLALLAHRQGGTLVLALAFGRRR